MTSFAQVAVRFVDGVLMHRDTARQVLAIAILTAAALPCSVPAQVRVQNGVVIRADLKADPFRAASRPEVAAVAAAAASAVKVCSTDDVCQTPVLVSAGGIDPASGKWSDDGCSAYWPYSTIKVRSALQPALRWVLVSDPGDPAKYAFDASYGIQLTGNTPHLDLYKPTIDATRTAFTWYNLHFRAKTVSFVPVVWRLDKKGDYEKKCNAGDPYVINEN